MSKKTKTTPQGDRQRHRDAVRARAPRKAMDGNHIRVRGVRRAEIDTTKLSLALWLIAKGEVHQAQNEVGDRAAEPKGATEDCQR